MGAHGRSRRKAWGAATATLRRQLRFARAGSPRASRAGGEEGIAMITVILLILVISLVALGVVAEAGAQQPLARENQNWQAALAAADAGASDYLSHLNSDANYWQYTPTSPGPGNPAFTGWVPVPSTQHEWFRYDVNNSAKPTTGEVVVTVSGMAGGNGTPGSTSSAIRTVKLTFRQQSFLNNLITQNYSLLDPLAYSQFGVTASPASCDFYAYQKNTVTGGVGPGPGCAPVYDTSGSTFNGSIQSNDSLYICGTPVFNGPVSVAAPVGSPAYTGPGCSASTAPSPTFNAGPPLHGASVTFPPNNGALAALAAATGCLYTGPTAIQLNASGTMTVTSPYTKQTNPGCLGTDVSLPADGVIYVQNMPSSPSDPNYTSPCTDPASWSTPKGSTYQPNLDTNCQQGDAFVQGVLNGQLTIAAQNNLIVTGNTTDASMSGSDVLGLVANNLVELYHPMKYNGNSNTYSSYSGTIPFEPGVGFTSPLVNSQGVVTIDAAIMSINHTFIVQNFSVGKVLGSLVINGAVASDFSATTGTFNSTGQISGYSTNFVYDSRLAYLNPPNFIAPASAAWQEVGFTELAPTATP